MTTTLNIEPWHVAMSRYESLLKIDRAMLDARKDDLGEDWERAHDATSAAIGLLMDTPAPTWASAVTKLRVIIRHAHLEGPSDDLNDPRVRAEALADPMRDGPWPLLRVLEDFERLQNGGSIELIEAAASVSGWTRLEQAGLDEANRLEECGEHDPNKINASLYLLDQMLAKAVVTATAIPSRSPSDLRSKASIVQAALSSGTFSVHGFSDEETSLIRSLCTDLTHLDT
jgi:hypothetical protein